MLCLKESDTWFNTGIFLDIQNAVLGLEVNGLAPRKWWVSNFHDTLRNLAC